MKLLALSDLHGNFSRIQALLQRAGEIDAVLIAGDITDFGPDHKARELMDMFHVPVMAIPGNCDRPSILKTLDESRAVNLHNSCFTLDNVNFIGLGGSNATPFNTPFELKDADIDRCLQNLLSQCKGIRTVLLCHAPPYGCVDKLPMGHVGSHIIAKFVSRPDLIICGHIHEARGITKMGDTVIVNVGEASKGYGALIIMNDSISAELIEV